MITQSISIKCPNLITLASDNKNVSVHGNKASSKSYSITMLFLKKKKKKES